MFAKELLGNNFNDKNNKICESFQTCFPSYSQFLMNIGNHEFLFVLFKAVINFSLLSQAKISAWFSEQIFSKTTLLCDFILFNLNFQPGCHKLDW